MKINFTLRLAELGDMVSIWQLLEQAIAKRKAEGSTQWQDGYPNKTVVENDIQLGAGYVVTNLQDKVVGYVAFLPTIEPAYEALPTGWLTYHTPYLVIHRLAVNQQPKIKGLATWILQQAEQQAKKLGVKSIKVDTNFDNAPMLHLFKKLQYTYAGEVYFRGGARMAFEKLV